MSTLKGELLPFVVKKQLSKQCKNIEIKEKLVEENKIPDIFNVSKESENNIRLMSCFGNVSNTEEIIKCYACVIDSNIGVRANTLYDYCKINKSVSNYQNFFKQQISLFYNIFIIYRLTS